MGGPIGPRLEEEWTVNLNQGVHDASKSSPAVDASGIYVGSDSGWMAAFRHDGRLKWRSHLENAAHGIHATPALDDKRAYVGAYNGVFYAFEKSSGDVLWSNHLGVAFGSSALIEGDYLYVAVEQDPPIDGNLVKLRREDGAMVWRSPFLGGQSHASPTLDRANGLLHVGANDGSFTALRERDGSVAWRIRVGEPIKSTAALVEGVLYFTSWAGKLHAVEAKTGKTLWERGFHPAAPRDPMAKYDMSSPTYVPDWDLLVFGTREGQVQAVYRKTGEPAWALATHFGWMLASALATPSSDERRKWDVWMLCERKSICLLDPRDGKVVSKNPLEEYFSGMPVAYGDSLYVAMDAPGGLSRFKTLKEDGAAGARKGPPDQPSASIPKLLILR